MPAGARDHRGVVGVETWTRDRYACESLELIGGTRRQCLTARDTAAEDGGRVAGGAHGALQFGDEHVDYGILESTRQRPAIAIQVVGRAHRMQHRGLQSGEGKLESVMDHGTRKVEAGRVAFGARPASASARSTTAGNAVRCARLASSGTTPPKTL